MVGDIYRYRYRQIRLYLPVHFGNKTTKTDYTALCANNGQKMVVYLQIRVYLPVYLRVAEFLMATPLKKTKKKPPKGLVKKKILLF